MHRQSFNQASLVIVAFALAISAAGILFSPVSGAGVCYVRAGAGGANNGTSWADAYTNLQSALGVSPCTEIWVAAGTYKPASGADRTATFQLKSGVAIYGGFDGTETSREERDWETNLTILSGDIDSNDIANPAEDTGEVVGNNSYHVVTGSGADTSAILDGFIITAGKSDNPLGEGGGMYINGGTPTLVNIIFSGNYASYGGGGLTTYGGILTLTNAGFKGNSAQLGGGMANYTNITLIEVTFSDNFATVHAGGLYNGNSTATLNDVVFVGNSVSGAGEHYGGGAMYNNFGSAILNNVVFSGNTVDSGSGGGLYNYATGNVVLNNVTFSNNTASLSGGGIYVYNTQTTIQNSILWGNSPAQVNVQNPITVTNSLVQNGCPEKGPYSAPNTCSNIISANPQFTDFDGIDDIIGTLDDDLRLLPASPALDAGDNATCTTIDLLGLSRPQGSACDMGAYELPKHSISGNAGSPGVTLEYTDGISRSVTADGAGEYTLWVSPNWSGAITPSKTGYIFVPVNRSYTEVITNLIGQDYIAQGVPIITEGESAEVTMDEDGSPDPFSLVLHASDPDGYGLYWYISSSAGHGAAYANGTGTAQAIQYFPEANYHGTDSFVVTVEDGDGGLDLVTVNVTIEPVNDLPVIAEGASVAAIMDEDGSPTPFNLTLHASDLDADAMLTWSLASPAGNGTAEVSGTGETMPVAYTPSTGYYGSDSFVVEVTDGTDHAAITVDVFVNQAGNTPPIIAEGASTALTISEDGNPTPFELSLHASDVDGDPSYWFVSTPAGHGIAGASGTGSSKAIYYTPAPDYYGDDSFIVTVEDGHGGAVTFTIGVTVEPVSDPVSIAEGNQVVVDMDEDGSPTPFGLTLHAEDPDPAETLTWSILTPASHGSAAISGTGISQAVTYTPSLEYAGTDSFVVQVDDGTSSDTISVYTVIHAVNDPVNISEGDSILVSIDEDGSPTAFALILNAVDPDVGEALTWSISTPAGHGTASASGPGASKSIGYIPEANYIGSDMFAVQVTDGANTDSITVSVTMASVNDSPADIGLSAAGVQENLPSGTVVGNLTCTDVDLGDSFIYSLAAGPGNVDNSLFAIVGNELRTAAVFDYEAGSAYSIRVRATDGGGLHHEKVFAIPITDANAAPTDIALSNSSVMGNMLLGTLVGRFSATDAEPAAAPFAYALVPGTGDEDNGSFTISGDQLLTDEVFDFAAKNTYSIRARVTDTGGMSHEETFSIAVTANNYRPILLEPANTASLLNNRPAFDWLSVPDAINYNILISRNNTPTTQVVNLTVTSSSYAPAVDLPAGTLLYWKVRTKWAGGYSPWSEARMLITARPPSVPTLVSPATNALVTNYSLKLDWNNSTVPAGAPDFQHYQIQVATDLDFEEIDTIYLETRTVSEFIPPVPWTANTKYYWRVRAVNALGQYSTWSLVRSLRAAMAAPVPSLPDNNTAPTLVTTMPAFQWGDVDGAAKYTIQISKNANLSSPVVNKIVPASEYIHTLGLSRNTIYYWRVRAEGPNGPGLWSASWTFKTGNPPTAPVLLAPANNILLTSYQPTLSWKAAAPATGTTVSYYYLQAALDPGFTSLVIDESRGLDLSYHFTDGLAPSKTFYWRVMAFGSNGHYSPWSVVRIFRTPLALPTLLLPSPGEATTLRQPLFDWNEVQFATSYTIQVSLSPTFTTLSVNVTRTATTYTPTTNLPLGTLHWRVRANGPNGPSPWSYSTVVISVP